MENIGHLFKLHPLTIYLVEEIDNIPVWPSKNSGKFRAGQLVPTYTYEVHGESVKERDLQSQQSDFQPTAIPYAAYTRPTIPHAPRSTKKASVTTKVLLVSLTARDTSRTSSSKVSAKVDYNIVTNVPLSLKPSQCNVKGVTQFITNQVGFQVVLLDSKCYLILDGEVSSVCVPIVEASLCCLQPAFWRICLRRSHRLIGKF